MRDKRRRQVALVRLVERGSVSSQEDMVRQLRKMGFHTAQTTVSRDVRELGLVRVGGRYVSAEKLAPVAARADAAVRHNDLIISADPVGANLIVVRTPPGGASTVAVELDEERTSEIAGTIAGDDTIFIAVRGRSVQGRVLALLRNGLRPTRSTARAEET